MSDQQEKQEQQLPQQSTAATERVLEHVDAAYTRHKSKRAAQELREETTLHMKSSRLQFTDEERAAPELAKHIRKSDKAADRLDAARAALPKQKKLIRERTYDEAAGKGKTRLRFEEREKPPPAAESIKICCHVLCRRQAFLSTTGYIRWKRTTRLLKAHIKRKN